MTRPFEVAVASLGRSRQCLTNPQRASHDYVGLTVNGYLEVGWNRRFGVGFSLCALDVSHGVVLVASIVTGNTKEHLSCVLDGSRTRVDATKMAESPGFVHVTGIIRQTDVSITGRQVEIAQHVFLGAQIQCHSLYTPQH